MSKEDSVVKVCPVCLSPRIDLYLGGYAGKVYKCLDCGYVGPLVIEVKLSDLVKLAEKKAAEKGDKASSH